MRIGISKQIRLLTIAMLSPLVCVTAAHADVSASTSVVLNQPSQLVKTTTPKKSPKYSSKVKLNQQAIPPFRGWAYLVEKLRNDGVIDSQLKLIFQDRRMPLHTPIPFSLNPRESHSLYSRFLNPSILKLARDFLQREKKVLDSMEHTFKVSRSVVAAIFLVETHFGQVTGRELVINRLARLASLAEPRNLVFNYERLKETDAKVQFSAVKDRANFLEDTFYPEILALLELARRHKIDIFKLQGSSAGAFGIPQFLPSSMLKFGVDGNKDGMLSLFHEADAIWSTANYLSSFGWVNSATEEEKRRVIWKYNHSEAYVDTVLKIADSLDSQ